MTSFPSQIAVPVRKFRAARVPAPASPARLAPGFRVDAVQSPDALAALVPDWRDLVARDPDSGLFLSPDWLVPAFRRHHGRWRVFALREAGPPHVLRAVFPARYRLRWNPAHLRFETEIEGGGMLATSELTGFVCDPDHEARALAALGGHLAGLPWVRLSLRYEPTVRRCAMFAAGLPDGLAEAGFQPLRINGGATDNLRTPFVALPDNYEGWLAALPGSNMRQKLRRFWRRCIDSGEQHVTIADRDSLDRDIAILLGQWTARWAPEKGAERARRIARQYGEMLRAAQAIDALFLPVLWQGDRPLGALGSVVDRAAGRLHMVLSGRDEAADAPATGLLLHAASIRWAIGQGLRFYDFGHGDEAYKYTYGATDALVANWVATRAGTATPLDPLTLPEALRGIAAFADAGRAAEAAAAARAIARELDR
jgi:CelD/BcsL family acetyltransferase involved in cellulose biosynthesis